MDLKEKTVGFALTGSFCTLTKVIKELEKLKETGINITDEQDIQKAYELIKNNLI